MQSLERSYFSAVTTVGGTKWKIYKNQPTSDVGGDRYVGVPRPVVSLGSVGTLEKVIPVESHLLFLWPVLLGDRNSYYRMMVLVYCCYQLQLSLIVCW